MPFYFRLNRVKIIDNRTTGFLFFKSDLASINLTSFITTNNTPLPDMSVYATYMKAVANTSKDAQVARDAAAAAMVASVINSRTLVRINWCLMAVVDDSEIRKLGQTIQNVMDAPGFSEFSHGLSMILNASGNPAYAAGIAITQFVVQTIAGILKDKDDELAGLLYMSLDQPEHYPHGERKSDGVGDLTGNMLVDYSLFGCQTPEACPKGAASRTGFRRAR